jgi:Peptidogalycan biosysnthesis/recognition
MSLPAQLLENFPQGLSQPIDVPMGLFISENWYQVASAMGSRHTFVYDASSGEFLPFEKVERVTSTSYRDQVAKVLLNDPEFKNDGRGVVGGSWNSNRIVMRDYERLPVLINGYFERVGPGAMVLPYLPLSTLGHLQANLPACLIEYVPCLSYASMEIQWRTFEEYHISLPKKPRHSLTVEEALCSASTTRHFGAPAGPLLEQAAILIAPEAKERQLALLDALHKTFQNRLLTFMLSDESGIRGICIAIEFLDQMYVRSFGGRRDAARDGYTYFCCVFHGPIQYCIAQGLKWIHLGIGAEEAKKLRGFTLLEQVTCKIKKSRTNQLRRAIPDAG